MRDSLEAYIGKGGNVAFFKWNTCCWQTRSEDEGERLHLLEAELPQRPQYQTRDFKTLSTLWSHHLVQRPETQLTGVGFLWGGYRKATASSWTNPPSMPCTAPITGCSRAPD